MGAFASRQVVLLPFPFSDLEVDTQSPRAAAPGSDDLFDESA